MNYNFLRGIEWKVSHTIFTSPDFISNNVFERASKCYYRLLITQLGIKPHFPPLDSKQEVYEGAMNKR